MTELIQQVLAKAFVIVALAAMMLTILLITFACAPARTTGGPLHVDPASPTPMPASTRDTRALEMCKAAGKECEQEYDK